MWVLVNKATRKVEQFFRRAVSFSVNGVTYPASVFHNTATKAKLGIHDVSEDYPTLLPYQFLSAGTVENENGRYVFVRTAIEQSHAVAINTAKQHLKSSVNSVRNEAVSTHPGKIATYLIKGMLSQTEPPTQGPVFDQMTREAAARGVNVVELHEVWNERWNGWVVATLRLDAMEADYRSQLTTTTDNDGVRAVIVKFEAEILALRTALGFVEDEEVGEAGEANA